MNLFHLTYDTVLEALFPISPAEKWMLSMDTKSICKILPRAKNAPIVEACSIFSYKDERVWRLIWSIKYKKSKRAVAISAFALHRIIQTYAMIMPKIVIIPMPVSKQRRRERGYNQCELITNEIGRLDIQKQLIVVNDLLLRKKNTSRQTLKDRKNRLESARELFVMNEKTFNQIKKDRPEILNSTFIVIDDVVTTGSTMKEAVSTMRNAGLTNTWGLSVAH